MSAPVASVVVPTADRPAYLEVTLASLEGQTVDRPFEIIVVNDGIGEIEPAHGARVVARSGPPGPNAARNTGIRAARAELVALVDDDVWAPPGWLEALLAGAERFPQAAAFGGPIRARLDGPAPRACGREQPPITSLELGPVDRRVELVWSANMALRREAFESIGPFDERFSTGGDEEEWLARLAAMGGELIYLADAWLDHRRVGDDARLRSLMRSAYRRGRNMAAYDALCDKQPALSAELRVLAGCGWHTIRRACPQGLIMGAHSTGRVAERLTS